MKELAKELGEMRSYLLLFPGDKHIYRLKEVQR